ncbi:unnamed protein product [Paramecium octaurelia]|uniref:RING-type domain-containing protein n=1 Tax=Paramecium octaurelia TaxID=43137 RepID=A0A8S1WSC9_PAROT|nr:unnamed protein product [Paramecium octaurelia]
MDKLINQFKAITNLCRNENEGKGYDSNQEDSIEKQNTQKNNEINDNDQTNIQNDVKMDVKECESMKNSQSLSDENQTQQQQNYNQNQSPNHVLTINSHKQFTQKLTESQNFPSQSQKSISRSVMYKSQEKQNFDDYCNQNYPEYQNQQQVYYQNEANPSLFNFQNRANQYLGNYQQQANQNLNNYGNQTNYMQSQIRFQDSPKRSTPIIQHIDQNQNFYQQQKYNLQYNQQNFQEKKETSQNSIIQSQQTQNKKIKILQMPNHVNQNNYNQTPIYPPQEFQNFNNYQQINLINNESQRQNQIRQTNQSFNSFNSQITITNYQSCADNISYAQTQVVKCTYCGKDVQKQYIQLNCQHFFCSDCLKEFLKNQSKQPDCYAYKCLCQSIIKLQVLFKDKDKDREVIILKEKLINNQLNTLRLNIQQKYQLKTCCNKQCSFFVIIQQNLEQKYFYCSQCLERQVQVQLNQ